MINRIVLIGRLTADPELRTAGSSNVCRFRVAVERSFIGQDGQRQTDFINCCAWNRTADFVAKYFRKGQMIAVDGSLRQESYKTQDGQERTTYTVNVDSVSFCGSRAETAAETQPEPEPRFDPKPEPVQTGFYDDQLPF